MRRATLVLLSIQAAMTPVPAQVIHTIIGGGPNNLPALSSPLGSPFHIATDSTGSYYFASPNFNRVYKVDRNGLMTVVAGNGAGGYSGDGGPATAASLANPNGVARDSMGNLFIADTNNCVIRKVDVSGNIQTVAGLAGVGCIVNVFNYPDNGVNGVSHFEDYNNFRDGGPATQATLGYPQGVAVDGNGNLYIADSANSRVRKVDTTGKITTIAGIGLYTRNITYQNTINFQTNTGVEQWDTYFNGDQAGASASLGNPTGIAIDANGNLLVADTNNQRIRTINLSATGNPITTIAGLGYYASTKCHLITCGGFGCSCDFVEFISEGFNGDGLAATGSALYYPHDVVSDASLNISFADSQNNRVRQFAAGGTLNTIAGDGTSSCSGTGTPYGDGGPATSARFCFAEGLAIDRDGNFLVTDSSNQRIRKFINAPAPNNLINSVAGNGSTFTTGNGIAASDVSLAGPLATAVNQAGDVYVGDSCRVLKKDHTTQTVSTIAGGMQCGFGGDGGLATQALLSTVEGLAADSAGGLYVADTGNWRVRKIDASGVITTVAGIGSYDNSAVPSDPFFNGDGTATSVSMEPVGLAFGPDENLLIADNATERIRKLNLTTNQVTTIMGHGFQSCGSGWCNGKSPDGTLASSAYLGCPVGVYADPMGNMFVTEECNHIVRKISAADGTINTAAGGGSTTANNIPATNEHLNCPFDIGGLSDGSIVFSDPCSQKVWRVSGGFIAAYAGTGTLGFNGDNIPASTALLANPYGVAIDPNDNLFIAENSNRRVREVVAIPLLTISADSKSAVSGAVLPALTVTFSGFVNGDSSASLTAQPVCTTTAAAGSPVGSYPITCSGAVDPVYKITYTAGTLTITPAPLTITADNKAKAYAAGLPSFTATMNGFVNGDTSVSLAAQPVCVTTATAASPVATYAINCSGAADANYSIGYVPGTLTITAVPLTIAADNKTKSYAAALPSFTATISGFVNGDTSLTLTAQPVCGTTATAASPVATYAINCSGAADANYSIGYVPGTLTVTSVPLTITADNQTKSYGSALPSLTVSYAGLVNGDTSASLSPGPSCTATATTSSAVGSYSITCSGAVDPNYSISYMPGTLTVAAAPLTISADNKSKAYAAALPAFTATITGLVNGDTPPSLAAQAVCGTTAMAGSAVGTYPITCSGAADTNYTINYQTGTLTITKIAITSIASNAGMVFGGPLPALTASLSGATAQASADGITASAATAATPASHIGSYPINAGFADPNNKLGNYSSNAMNAILNVTAFNQNGSTSVTPAEQIYTGPVTFKATLPAGMIAGEMAAMSASFYVCRSGATSVTAACQNMGPAALAMNGGAATGSASLNLVETAAGALAPGAHTVFALFGGAGADFVLNMPVATLIIDQKPASPAGQTFYTGASVYWTPNAASNAATLFLTATVLDPCRSNPPGYQACGDIRKGTVTFAIWNGTSLVPIHGATNLPIGLVNPGDTTVGSAAATVQYNLGGANSQTLDVRVILGGAYSSGDPSTDAVVLISKPLAVSEMKIGGALLCNSSTAVPNPQTATGTCNAAWIAPDAGLLAGVPTGVTQIDGDVALNKPGTNAQGQVTAIVVSMYKPNGTLDTSPHTYQIKSNAILTFTGLPGGNAASFTAQADIQDLTTGASESDALIEVTACSMGATSSVCPPAIGAAGAVAIQVNSGKTGAVWFSSGWNGKGTVTQNAVGGKVQID